MALSETFPFELTQPVGLPYELPIDFDSTKLEIVAAASGTAQSGTTGIGALTLDITATATGDSSRSIPVSGAFTAAAFTSGAISLGGRNLGGIGGQVTATVGGGASIRFTQLIAGSLTATADIPGVVGVGVPTGGTLTAIAGITAAARIDSVESVTIPATVPDWVISTPSTPAIHNQPAKAYQWQQPSQDAIASMRGQLIDTILQTVMDAVGQFIPGFGSASNQLGTWFSDLTGLLGNPQLGSGSVDTNVWASGFVTDILNPTGLLASMSDSLQGVINDLLGTGSSTADFTTWLGDLFNSNTSANNKADLANTNVLDLFTGLLDGTQMVNANSLFGGLPAHMLSSVPVSNITDDNPNLLTAPGFNIAQSLWAGGPWTWDSSTGHTTPGCAKVAASGVVNGMMSNPVIAPAGTFFQVQVFVKWSGLSAATSPLLLEMAEYSGGVYKSATTVMSVPSPGTSSDWVSLGGQYTVPSGADTVRVRLVVDQAATAGTVWWDDASLRKVNTQLDNNQITGTWGQTSIGQALQNTWDHLFNALSPTQSNNVRLSDLASSAQNVVSQINQAQALAAAANNELAIRTNKPGFMGLQDTVEATFPLTQIPAGSTPSSIAVTQSAATMGFVRIAQKDTKGFVSWYGSGNTNITHCYVDIYRMDTTTGDLTLVHNSSDLASYLASGWSWIEYVLPGPDQIEMRAGDVIGVEIRVTGSGTHNVAGLPLSWMTNHPTAFPRQLAASRDAGTGAAPASIPDASIAYTGAVPWIGLGVSNVPADWEPADVTQYSEPGTYSHTLPTWNWKYVDVVALGGGGGGQSAANWVGWTDQGGSGGQWRAVTLEKGVDIIADTATTLTVTVGAGGTHPMSMGPVNGNPGGDSTISYFDIGSDTRTVTAAGGLGGGANNNSSSNGLSPGNEVYNGITYFGGAEVTYDQPGSFPGGGGGGAGPFALGADGANGTVWVIARQA